MVAKIKNLCWGANMSLNDLERVCGFGKNTVSKWDKHIPSVDKAKKVADFFGVTLDELMEELKEDA